MGIPSLDAPEVQLLSIREAIQPQLARLLLLVGGVTDAKMKLAIGGAVAARDAGWRRYTDDLERVRDIVATADETQVTAVMSRGRRALKPPGVREKRVPYLGRAALDQAWKATAAARQRSS